jgi:hypothetical protein
MKKQTSTTKTLIHTAAAAIAIAIALPAKAADVLVDFGDFNHDGLDDVAAITSPTTITISLANWDGSYVVSAILTAPKNQQFTYIDVYDRDGDGDLDVIANSPASGTWYYTYTWLGNGDGTFGSRTSDKWSWPPKGNHHGGF